MNLSDISIPGRKISKTVWSISEHGDYTSNNGVVIKSGHPFVLVTDYQPYQGYDDD